MKKFAIQSILLIIIIAGALFFYQSQLTVPFLPQTSQDKEIVIGDKILKVEIADTQEKRSKGLGGVESLATDSGMLFTFEKEDKYAFWMKGLKFPLDLIYIRDNIVVDIIPNVPAPTEGQKDEDLEIYLPKEPVDRVLEVNAGTVEKLMIKIGDVVSE